MSRAYDNNELKQQLTELISGVQDEGLNFDNCIKDGDKPTVVENVTVAQHLMSCGVTIHTKAIPRLPFPDGDRNILSCPWCRSGEFLHNADGTQMPYCGQCGQAIDWDDKNIPTLQNLGIDLIKQQKWKNYCKKIATQQPYPENYLIKEILSQHECSAKKYIEGTDEYREEFLKRFWTAFMALPQKNQLAIEYRYRDLLKYKDAATKMGVTTNQFSAILIISNRKLRRILLH